MALPQLARPRSDLAMREVINQAGGTEALEEACELAGADPLGDKPLDVLLSYLRDPAFANHAPTTLAQKAGLSRLELFDLLGKRDVALAVFNSRRKHLAAVLDDIGEDSRTLIVRCRNCEGKGMVALSKDELATAQQLIESGIDIDLVQPCPDCDGSGKLRKLGDGKSRDQFLKIHGFDKGGAAVISPTFNVGVGVQVKNGSDSNKPEPITVRVEKLLEG